MRKTTSFSRKALLYGVTNIIAIAVVVVVVVKFDVACIQ
jgi:hypothetical protein